MNYELFFVPLQPFSETIHYYIYGTGYADSRVAH